MQRTDFSSMRCSIARAWSVVGEPWTPLILRDVYLGLNRFTELQQDLGVSRKVLTQRLDTLVEEGVLERRPYQEHPSRHEYVLTEKGLDLVPALLALMAWGDRWAAPTEGPPVTLHHERCGHDTSVQVTCMRCGEALDPAEVRPLRGPGGGTGAGTRLVGRYLG